MRTLLMISRYLSDAVKSIHGIYYSNKSNIKKKMRMKSIDIYINMYINNNSSIRTESYIILKQICIGKYFLYFKIVFNVTAVKEVYPLA